MATWVEKQLQPGRLLARMCVCVCVCVCVKQCDCSRDALKSHSEESDEGGRLERRGRGAGEEREEVGVKLRQDTI